jgi:hypothetical protein
MMKGSVTVRNAEPGSWCNSLLSRWPRGFILGLCGIVLAPANQWPA